MIIFAHIVEKDFPLNYLNFSSLWVIFFLNTPRINTSTPGCHQKYLAWTSLSLLSNLWLIYYNNCSLNLQYESQHENAVKVALDHYLYAIQQDLTFEKAPNNKGPSLRPLTAFCAGSALWRFKLTFIHCPIKLTTNCEASSNIQFKYILILGLIWIFHPDTWSKSKLL